MVYNIGNLSYVTHGSILMHISFITPPGDDEHITIELPAMLGGKHIRQVSGHIFDPNYHIESERHTIDPELQIRKYPIDSLIIDEGIEIIGAGAFKKLMINEVFWAESCKHIPANCFSGSHVGKIYDIENVNAVGQRSFYKSKWRSPLKFGTELEEIGEKAFHKSECFLDFAAAPGPFTERSVEEISEAFGDADPCLIRFPYFMYG